MQVVLTGDGKDEKVVKAVAAALGQRNIQIKGHYESQRDQREGWGCVVDLAGSQVSFSDLQSQMRALSTELLTNIRVQRADLFIMTNRVLFPSQSIRI